MHFEKGYQFSASSKSYLELKVCFSLVTWSDGYVQNNSTLM